VVLVASYARGGGGENSRIGSDPWLEAGASVVPVEILRGVDLRVEPEVVDASREQ
jgi:hypothetical protein